MRFLAIVMITCCLAAPAVGQSLVLPKTPLLQRTIGGYGQDELLSLTVNWRGDLAAVGNAANGSEGGQDIAFVAFDAQLNKLVERHIGRKGDDGAGQIASMPDGRYLLAGYSTKPSGRPKTRVNYIGKRDGWVLLLNERGETEREILLGTTENDAFVSVTVCPDGSAWLAGNAGNQGWIVRLNTSLEVAWEKKVQYHQLPTHIAAATITPGGDFFVVGGVKELARKHLWTAGFDQSGKPIMEKIYPSSQAESGTGIAAIDSFTLAIVGIVDDPKDRENGFVSILDHRGVVRAYHPLGGREFDQLNTLTYLRNGQLLAGGGSASFERGSRRISAWLNLLEADGKIKQEIYYGSKLDDEVLAFAEHPDGRLFAIGTTARHILKLRQGWLFQMTGRSERKAKSGKLQAQVKNVVYPSQGTFLSQSERSFVAVTVENKGASGQHNLRAVISAADKSAEGKLSLPGIRSALLPPVGAKEHLAWGLPLQFKEGTPAGTYRFQVQFFQDQLPIGELQFFEVNIGQTDQPRLELSAIVPDSGFVVGLGNFLLVEVRNTGTKEAKSVTLNASTPLGIRLPSQVLLGDLAPGGKLQYKLPVLIEATGSGLSQLHLRVADESLLYTAETEAKITVHAPVASKVALNKTDYTLAVWVYPNPDNFDRTPIVWTQEEITVQVKVVSSQPVTRPQFCLEINEQACPSGAKFDEVQIKGDRTSKTFSQTVRLVEGENVLRATFKTPNGEIGSERIKIVYTPAKPNLHIVSIGVPATDLKYTSKDAHDFAAALSGNRNIAFGKIFMDTLITEARTTKTEILKALRRLQYRYADLQILPKDLLVIFVSGHGLGAYDGSFRLAASDYDGPFMQETSLDFELEIVNYLQSLPCRKLFFVDACHSGTTTGTGLAGIAVRKNGLNMLLSCHAEEFSYEDDSWENGAFTRALVRGIETFERQPALVDQNADSVLDLSELFGFVQKEVPNLVDKKRPKAKTSQRPKLILADANRPVPLFEVRKRK